MNNFKVDLRWGITTEQVCRTKEQQAILICYSLTKETQFGFVYPKLTTAGRTLYVCLAIVMDGRNLLVLKV